ncbi:MAG: hypothetical protein ACRD2N_17685 [Vicinamibacterales bacterium]
MKFKEREVTDGNEYLVYTAVTRADAMSFLRSTPVKEERHYLIVETPDGSVGKDMIMVFDERTSEGLEFGTREPLPALTKSTSHCSKCGYPVLPAAPAVPGVKELLVLDELKDKGVGLICVTCRAAWCPFCVSGDSPDSCHFCGTRMSLVRE